MSIISWYAGEGARREALSPQSSPCKKTAPRKKTAVTKGKSAKETKSKSGEKTRSNSGSKAKGRNGEKASKEKTRSEKAQQKLADIQRVQKEAEWMFTSEPIDLEVR